MLLVVGAFPDEVDYRIPEKTPSIWLKIHESDVIDFHVERWEPALPPMKLLGVLFITRSGFELTMLNGVDCPDELACWLAGMCGSGA